MVQASQVSYPPKVTGAQWALMLLSLALAGLSYSFTSYESLAIFAPFLTMVSIALVVNATMEVLRTRVLGKLFLAASTFFFFWLEALILAGDDPPFGIAGNPAGISGQFGQDLIQQAYFYVALFQLMLFAGYSIRPRTQRILRWVASRVDSHSFRTSVLRYGLVACTLVPLLLSFRLDIGDLVEAMIASRSGSGPAGEDIGFWQYLYFFGVYGSALLLAEALLLRGSKRIQSFLLGGIAAIPFVMLWGARHHWLFIALPFLILILARSKGRIDPHQAIRWGVAAFFIIVVSQAQLILRQEGWDQIGSLTPAKLVGGSYSGQFSALLFAEHFVPEIHGYFFEFAEPFFIYHWVPRRFWPGKPVMESWSSYNDFYTQGQAFNVTPSVIGQFHMNFGMFGVMFIGVWLGFLTFLADRMLLAIDVNRQQTMAVTIGILYGFIITSFRFYSPIYLTYVVFAVFAMLPLSYSMPRDVRGLRDHAASALRHLSLP